jgi:hypothetical protein
MHIIPASNTNQSIRREGICNVIELLEFVNSEWNRFENSKRPTMRDLRIPPHITHLVIKGMAYDLGNRRELWFEKVGKGYHRDRFYISEAISMSGHPYQLHLDRSSGALYDDLNLVRAKRLGVPSVSRTFSSTGPLVRE